MGSFNDVWEYGIFKKDRQLNLYPHNSVVSFLLKERLERRRKMKVLEVGCGTGNNIWMAAREGYQVYGVDGSKSAIKIARDRFDHDLLTGKFSVGDISKLEFKDSYFDIVIDRAAIYCNHHSDIKKIISEISRVLKRGGKFLSMIYGDQHPASFYGEEVDKNTYGSFTGGYFKGMGTAYFLPATEIDELYSPLEVTSVQRILEEKRDGVLFTPNNDYFIIEAQKV
jgi:SAM-dependent methyltransferase